MFVLTPRGGTGPVKVEWVDATPGGMFRRTWSSFETSVGDMRDAGAQKYLSIYSGLMAGSRKANPIDLRRRIEVWGVLLGHTLGTLGTPDSWGT